MDYDFRSVEKKWREKWEADKTYKTEMDASKEKCYVLDMFPYPSGAGLHVGHPLGYIASDIYARFKRLKGFNVLHPMGYDAFGLPAEQYAIQTGQHPAITTDTNLARYREQLDKIGFSFDWDREVRTCDPSYYKWTQWIFSQLFNSWYNKTSDKAEPIAELISKFETEGNSSINAACDETEFFSADEWNSKSEKEKSDTLLNYRLAFLSDTMVNWCPALGTVLANDEIKDGVSERGGHPVERKSMQQWSLRITAYAQRLLDGLNTVDWTDAIKEMQRNWIGRSEGASLRFNIKPHSNSPQEGEDLQAWQTADPNAYEELKRRANELKNNCTETEQILWDALRGKNLGVKFRRQHIIGTKIVDFVCLEKKLTIELDGKIHEFQKEEDAARTSDLESLGFKEIRFTNEEILQNLDSVIEKITSVLQVLPTGEDLGGAYLEVFTTRPDTIFGVSFMVIAPEHEYVNQLTTADQKSEVEAYVEKAKNRSERDRMADVKTVSGVFTGSYVKHPFTGKDIPIWIGDYVLATYGTGAVMSVAAHDSRDYAFAKHFNLPILPVVEGGNIEEEAHEAKSGKIINSDFINGLEVKDAMKKVIAAIEEKKIGKGQINYRLRDAVFSRQRYWGEPFPVYFKNGIPYLIEEKDLPLTLPEVEKYLPTETGEPPLGNAIDWKYKPLSNSPQKGENEVNDKVLSSGEDLGEAYPYELSTMPGWAGSSWYYLRYMDPNNSADLVDREKADYWGQVDLYIGGSEHATGHLLYSRFWCKFLYDLGKIGFDEPFKKMINQGMILGTSNFVYRVKNTNKFVSKELKHNYETTAIHADVNMVHNDELDIEAFKNWRAEFADAEFELEDGKYICGEEVEKMSKSKYNVVNPDIIVDQHGADVLRMYEMFLGPLEQFKPWSTKGIDGVSRFVRKYWNLHHDGDNNFVISDEEPTKDELKVLHKTIKKAEDDVNGFSFNTSVSAFMVCVNELTALKCNKKAILEPLAIILSPYAPFITEELWSKFGNSKSITQAQFPEFDPSILVESSYTYPVMFNGKMRFKVELDLSLSKDDIEKEVMSNENMAKWLGGKSPKKVIVVPKKIVNIVI